MVSVARPPAAATSVEHARGILLAGITALAEEDVELRAALGRVLAHDVVARADLPGTDNSSMDGYAVASRDLAGAAAASPVVLPLGAECRAGYPAPDHRCGTASTIATGAPLPRRADVVVAVERTRLVDDGVRFTAAAPAGGNIRRRGEDVSAGTSVVTAGRRLRSVDVGVCAAAGAARVRVARRPRVALISCGDELVAPGTAPLPHQVVDVNTAMLAAAVEEAGGVAVPSGVVRDDHHAMLRALERARDTADLVVTSAGVSMGGHDHVRDCVAELGNVDLWTVPMRPGRPLLIGRVGAIPLVGLPGNPVSSAVTFLLFARAAILALQRASHVLPIALPVLLGESFEKPAALETYLRVWLRMEGSSVVARSSGGQGSAMMHGLGSADALLVLPVGPTLFEAGSTATALPLP
jgi:molybdopterin molybdotransferase